MQTSKGIRRFVKSHKDKQHWLIAMIILSLVVAVTVVSSLIMPGITISNDPNNIATYMEGKTPIKIGEGNNKIKDVSFEPYPNQEDNLDSKTGMFEIAYDLEAGQLTLESNIITYQLPENVLATIEVDPEYFSTAHEIYDGGKLAGTFTIDQNGLVTIICAESYITENQTNLNTSGAHGTFKFKATVKRDKDNSGDVDLDFGISGEKPYITVDFKDRTLSVEKQGSLSDDKKSAQWTIIVRNPDEHDLGGYTIADKMFANSTDFSSEYGTLNDDGSFTFNEGVKDKKIEISYTTSLSQDQIVNADWNKLVNEVTLTPDDPEEEEVNDTAEVPVGGLINISKSGTANYDDMTNPSIDWKINVSNPNGYDLDGIIIKDEAFKYLELDDITLPEGVSATLDTEKGTLTLSGSYTGENLEITYKSTKDDKGNDITIGSYVYNKASIVKKDENTEYVSGDVSVDYKPFTFEKNGSVDNAKDTIKWTVKIWGNAIKDFENYVVKDEMFANAKGDITFKFVYNGETQVITPDSDGKFTIPSRTDENGNEIEYDGIEITFTTSASDLADDDGYVKNTAELYNPDGEKIKDVETTVKYEEYVPQSKLDKYSEKKENIDDNEDKFKIEHKYYLTQEAGVTAQTLTDTLTATDGALHYISKEQALAMTVKGNWQREDLDSSLYTLTFYDKDGEVIDFSDEENANAQAVKFTLELKEGIEPTDERTYVEIEVYYFATADASGDDVKSGTVKFTNEVKTDSDQTIDTTNNTKTIEHKKIDYTDTPYKKVDAVNKLNESTISNGDLETVTIDGKKHYVLGWYVVLNENGNYNGKNHLKFTDVLPKGFELYGDVKCYWGVGLTEASSGNYNPSKISYHENTTDNWYDYYFTETSNDIQTVTIFLSGTLNSETTLYYEAVIPVEELDKMFKDNNGTLELKNIFDDINDKYDPVTQTETINQGQLNKESITEGIASQYKKYEVEVNPNGAYLNSGSPIVLNDVFKTQSCTNDGTKYYCYDKGAVNVRLEYIKVYEVSEDGTRKEINSGEWSYIFDNQPPEKTVTYTYKDFTKSDNIFTKENVQLIKGTTVKVKFNNAVKTGDEWSKMGFAYYFNGNRWSDPNGYIDDCTIDDDGNITGTFNITKDIDIGTLYFEMSNFTADSVEISFDHIEHDYAAKLDVTVPDGKKLVVEYMFYCEPNEYANDYVGVVNTVESNINSSTSTSEVGDNLALVGSGGGTITTKTGLTVKKVDVGSYSTKLEAEFKLYKYDSINNVWVPAKEYKEPTSDKTTDIYDAVWGESTDEAATFKTTGGSYNVNLTTNSLYKLVEVTPPTGYVKNDNPIYFTYGTYAGNYPDGVTSTTVNKIIDNGNLNVTNFRKTQITVNKIWDSGDHSNDSVKVKLYRSTKHVTIGFPSDEDMVEVNTDEVIEINASKNWTYTWSDLPTGDDKGNAYYYYVKEISYTVGGTENTVGTGDYSTYYTGNGINYSDENTAVEILNSIGLQVKKEWVDKNNKTMEPGATSVNFTLYRSLTPNSLSLPSDAEKVSINDLTDFTLNAENEWTMMFTDLAKTDDDGKTYYYYVVETTETDGFTVHYIGNGKEGTGVITIRNQSDKSIDTGVELPHTGGNGITFYFVIGFAIIVSAVISILINNKQKSKE